MSKSKLEKFNIYYEYSETLRETKRRLRERTIKNARQLRKQ